MFGARIFCLSITLAGSPVVPDAAFYYLVEEGGDCQISPLHMYSFPVVIDKVICGVTLWHRAKVLLPSSHSPKDFSMFTDDPCLHLLLHWALPNDSVISYAFNIGIL